MKPFGDTIEMSDTTKHLDNSQRDVPSGWSNMVQLGGAPAWSMVHVYDCTAIVLGISHIGYPNP